MADRFVLSAEQQDLRAGVRQFCAEFSDEATVRRLMDSAAGYDPKTWARLGAELGVLGLAVPTEFGGAGGGLVEAAVAVEELGAALLPGPVVGTVALAIPALVALSDVGARAELLPPLVEGARTAAFAVPAPRGRFSPDGVAVEAAPAGDGWTLTGEVAQVVDGPSADLLLVAAHVPDGVALFAVEGAAGGVTRVPLSTLDLTRPQASVSLAGAPARLLGGPGEADRVCGHAFDTGAVLLAAEQVGVAAHLLELTVGHAKGRMQFGRPIGSFQAIKHRLADMLVAVEHARSAAYHAAWALQDGTDDPGLAASIAQVTCSEAAYRVAADAIQLHGGIGFTWEHQAHLYYKRAVTDAALLGSAEEHRERIAELVLDTAVVRPGVPPVAGEGDSG